MLDIVVPFPIENVDLVPAAIDALETNTDIPFRLIVAVDGGSRSDFAIVESRVRAFGDGPDKWLILHEQPKVHLNQLLNEAFAKAHAQLVAVVPPQFWIDDVKWFGKMQQVFLKDPLAGIVTANPFTASATAPPHKKAMAGVDLFMVRRSLLVGELDRTDWPSTQLIKRCQRIGMTTWHAPGVRYTEIEHKEHPFWREPSAVKDQSASPSRTTRASSSRTTTEMGG